MLKAIAWLNVMQSGKIRPNPRNVFCRIRTTRPPAGLYGKQQPTRCFLAVRTSRPASPQLDRIAALLLAALHTTG